MTLEALLLIGALAGGTEAQNKTIEAYGRYSGINAMIQRYGEKNPELSFLIGIAGIIKEKRLYYKIHGPWHHDIRTIDNSTTQFLWFKGYF